MLTWLLILASLWPLLWLLRILLVTKVVLGLEIRARRVTPLPEDRIPAHLLEAAQPLMQELAGLGFRVLGGLHDQNSPDGALDEWEIVLAHNAQPVCASIRPHERADEAGQCSVWFRTTTREGMEIVTAGERREQLIPLPPGFRVEAAPGLGTTVLFQRHQERIAAAAAEAWHCRDIEGAATRAQYIADGIFTSLRMSGLMTQRDDATLSFRPSAAWRRAAAVIEQEAQRKKERAAARKTPAASAPPVAISPASQLEFDLQHYRATGALLGGKLSRRSKAILTAVSFLAFAAVIGWSYSPVAAASLIVALIVHEGGHLLGMRWFGHRDTQLLFIPFFGGAAVGLDDKVLRPWQHIVIILLGPLPGLFAGIAVLCSLSAEAPGWSQEAALTFVVLNGFNLLPILPLDGGQIVDYAIASRFPRARVFFLAGSALALLGVAWLGDGLQLIGVLALLTLVRLPVEWKLARLRVDLRREYPDGGDEEPIVRGLLKRVRAPEWRNVPMMQRLTLVRGLQNVLRMPRAGFGTLCFAVAGYTAPLWVGLPLGLWAMRRQSAERLLVAEHEVRAAGLGRAELLRPQATVPDDHNAAVLVGEAEVLLSFAGRVDGRGGVDPRIVELLHAAAKRPAFVPVGTTKESGQPRRPNPRFARGLIVHQLLHQAEERLRFREPEAAAALTIDALRLIRLLDTAPGWLPWENHRQLTASAWKVIEEIFAAPPGVSAAFLAELRPFIDEEHEIAFAATAMPHDLLQHAAAMEKGLGGADEAEDGAIPRWLQLLPALMTDQREMQAQFLTSAVAVDRALKQIKVGKWPANDPDNPNSAHYHLRQLAEMLARLRQARAAVQIAERRTQGIVATSITELGLEGERLKHPLTNGAMTWTRRGNLEVLSFVAPSSDASELAGLGEALVWRLPAK